MLLSTYNGSAYLEELLDSIVQQKNVEVNLLVRDDGSTDVTCDILSEYRKKYRNIVIIRGENVGCASSFKELLIAAYHYFSHIKYFAFADQDDIWLPEKLISGIKIMSGMPENELNLYCSNLIVVDNELNIKGYLHPKVLTQTLSKTLIRSIATGCTMIFNFETVKFFNQHQPQNMRLHDLWLYHTCMLFGNVYYDSNSYIYYRQHGNNIVGAKISKRDRLKSKMNSLKYFWKQHNRENEAKELLCVYDGMLPFESRDILKRVALFRSNIRYKIDLLFSNRYDFKMDNRVDNFWFKIRVIFNCI